MPAEFDSSSVTLAAEAAVLDAILLSRAGAGDVGSFERLLARYRAEIVGFLTRMLADPMLAEDLAQEAFLRVYQKASEFRGDSGSVRSWIYAIARNLAIDHERKKFRLFGRRGKALPLDRVAEPEGGEAPERAAQREEVRARLEAVIATLSEPFRSAIVLVDISRLSYEEASLALGCSVKTLSSRLARARRSLRDRIDPALLESLE